MPVGALTVDFVANIAKYVEDLGKSAAQTEAAARRIEGSLNNAFASIKKNALELAAALGVGFSLKGLEDMVSGAIEAEAELGRIGARAGVTGEEISKLSVAARLSHTDLADLADMSAKLSKALLVSQDATTKQAAVFKALGFSSSDTAKLLADPANALLQFSKSLTGLDSGTKVAAMMVAIGRGGNQAAGALAELAKQTDLTATRSQAEIDAATAFDAKLVHLGISADNLKTSIGNAILGTVSDVVDALTKMSAGAGGAKDTVDKLAADGSLKQWARDGAIALATVAESLIFVGKNARLIGNDLQILITDLAIAKGGYSALGAVATDPKFKDPTTGDAVDNLRSLFEQRHKLIAAEGPLEASVWVKNTQFTDALRKQFAASDAAASSGAPAQQIGSADSVDRRAAQAAARAKAVQDAVATANSRGDDPARKILEAALAALKAYTDQEKAVLANRNQYLQAEFDRGDVSIADYYQAKQAAQDEDLARTTENYDKQIVLINAFIAHASTLKDKAQGEKEKVAATSAQALAVTQAAGKSQQILDDQAKALKDYGKTLDEVNAKLLELQGNTQAAAKIRFDAQNDTFRAGLQSTINSPSSTPEQVAAAKAAQDRLAIIEKSTVGQAALNDVTQKYSLILNQVSLVQSRIDLAQQTGQLTELQAINLKAEAATAKIASLNAELAQFAKTVASEPDGPIKDADILKVEQMKLQIDQLAATSDALAAKFRDIFEGSAASFLTDLISGTKTVKQAFLDMGRSIEQSISQIAAKNIAETLFGKGGQLGGIPDFFSNLFGGGGAASLTGGASLAASAATLTASGGVLATAGASLIAAAAALGAQGIGSAASLLGTTNPSTDPFSALGGIFGGLFGAAAGGTDFARGGMTLVGEKGPEIVNLPQGAQVIPNDILRAARSAKQGATHYNTFNVNVLPGASRASAAQAAAEVGRQVQQAQRIR